MKLLKVRIKFDKLLHDTGKAILVRIQNKEIWLGHFMIKNLVVNKKLGGHFETRPKTCDEKGIYYSEEDATKFIYTHIPIKLDITNINHDGSLAR